MRRAAGALQGSGSALRAARKMARFGFTGGFGLLGGGSGTTRRQGRKHRGQQAAWEGQECGREKSQALQKQWWEEGGRGRSQLVGLS